MFCTHVISFNAASVVSFKCKTCLAFRLRRLRRLCPKTKESWAFWRHLSVEPLERLGLATDSLQIMYTLYYLCYLTSYHVPSKVAFKSLLCKHRTRATVWWYCRQRPPFFLEKSKFVLFFEQHRFCLQYQPVRAEKKSWISWVAFWEKKGVFRKHSKYVIRIWVFVWHDHKTRSPNDHNGREDRRAADDGWMEILPLLNVDDVNVCPSTIPHLWFYASGSMARNDIYNPPYFTVYTSFILKWNN